MKEQHQHTWKVLYNHGQDVPKGRCQVVHNFYCMCVVHRVARQGGHSYPVSNGFNSKQCDLTLVKKTSVIGCT